MLRSLIVNTLTIIILKKVFCKKAILKKFENFTGKHLCEVSFNEVALSLLLKRGCSAGVFL